MKSDAMPRLLLAISLLSIPAATAVLADVPRTIHFQGVLTDDGGLPLTGEYSFTFSIYSDTTVAAIWSQVSPVQVEGGFYDAVLDVAGVSFAGPLYLGIEVGGSALGPKKPFASVPHALSVPDGSVTSPKIPPAQVVKSLNSMTDSVRIVAGSQVSVLESGDSIIISASIEGAGADGDWTVNGGDMYAQVPGNVGIGVAGPAEKLDVAGVIRTDSRFVSTMADGTAPIQVASSTLVDNLNADLLDGEHASAFAAASHAHDGAEIASGTVPFERLPVGATGTTVAQGDHTHAVADDGDWTVSGGNVYRVAARSASERAARSSRSTWREGAPGSG